VASSEALVHEIEAIRASVELVTPFHLTSIFIPWENHFTVKQGKTCMLLSLSEQRQELRGQRPNGVIAVSTMVNGLTGVTTEAGAAGATELVVATVATIMTSHGGKEKTVKYTGGDFLYLVTTTLMLQ
jgi:hypothetical protein